MGFPLSPISILKDQDSHFNVSTLGVLPLSTERNFCDVSKLGINAREESIEL